MNKSGNKALIRRRVFLRIGLGLILLVVLGPYLIARISAPGRMIQVIKNGATDETPEAADEISILIFNIAHGRGPVSSNLEEGGAEKRERVDEIAALLKHENADIVVLNEVDFCSTWSGHQNQAEALAIEAGYSYRAEQRNMDFRFIYGSWQFGNAILSRFPITEHEVIGYPFESQLESVFAGGKKGAVFTIELPDGKMVDLLPVHLEHRNERTRIGSIERILDRIEQRNRIPVLCGDFNSTPDGTPGSAAIEGGGNAMDTLIHSGHFHPLELPDGPRDYTFSVMDSAKTIDWIVVPLAFETIEYRVIDSRLSDHRPVFARIKLTSQGGADDRADE